MTNEGRGLYVGSIMLVAGIGLGFAAGLLMAPQSGARSRRQLRNFAADVEERARCLIEDTKEAVGNGVKYGRSLVA